MLCCLPTRLLSQQSESLSTSFLRTSTYPSCGGQAATGFQQRFPACETHGATDKKQENTWVIVLRTCTQYKWHLESVHDLIALYHKKFLYKISAESTWFWPLVKPSNQKMLRSIVLSLLLCALALANDRVQITTIHEGDRVSIPKAGYVSVPFPLLFLPSHLEPGLAPHPRLFCSRSNLPAAVHSLLQSNYEPHPRDYFSQSQRSVAMRQRSLESKLLRISIAAADPDASPLLIARPPLSSLSLSTSLSLYLSLSRTLFS